MMLLLVKTKSFAYRGISSRAMKPADDVSLPRKKNLGRSKITTKMWREGERERERGRER